MQYHGSENGSIFEMKPAQTELITDLFTYDQPQRERKKPGYLP